MVILPLLDDGRVLLERQFRYPHTTGSSSNSRPGKSIRARITWIAPSANCRKKPATPRATGSFVCTIHNAIAYSDEHLEIFLARGLWPAKPSSTMANSSNLHRHRPELLDMVSRGEVTDVKTVIGAFWLEKIIAGDWKPA